MGKERLKMNEAIRKNCQERFANHKATLIQDTDRYLAIDWRKGNGSGDYYVNYILDKKRGNIIISGDLGDCFVRTNGRNFIRGRAVPLFMQTNGSSFIRIRPKNIQYSDVCAAF